MTLLNLNPTSRLKFILSPAASPVDIQVLEIAYAQRDYIDASGVSRSTVSCILYSQIAENDQKPRTLIGSQLLSLFAMAEKILPSDELAVEVEFANKGVAAHFVRSAQVRENEIHFRLVDAKNQK
jgi:hypothetical protein